MAGESSPTGAGRRPPGTGGRAPGPDADGPDRATLGTWIAAVVGIGGALALGAAVGGLDAVAVGVAAAVGLAAAVRLLGGPDALLVGAGAGLAVPAIAGLVVAPVLGPPRVTVALSVAAFGAAAGPLRALGRARFVESLGVLTYGLVPLGTAAIASALPPLGVAVAGLAVGNPYPAVAEPNLLAFSALATAAAVSIRGAVREVPAAELVPRGDRERVARTLSRVDAGLTGAIRWALGGVVVGFVVWSLVALDSGVVPRSVSGTLARTVGSDGVRWALVAATVAGLVVTASVRAVRWTGTTLLDRARRGAAAATGMALAVALVALDDRVLAAATAGASGRTAARLADFVSVLGVTPTVLLSSSVLSLSFVLVALVLPGAVGVGIAPERAIAPAVAATGLVAGSALAAGSAPPAATFGGVAAALVVWDVGEHAVGVGEELGDRPGSMPQVVHALASLSVGALAVAGAAGLHSLVGGRGPSGPVALAGMAVAFLGALLLVAALRG